MAAKLDRVNVQLDPSDRDDLDSWRMAQRPIPPSAGAIRYILREFLDQWKCDAAATQGAGRRDRSSTGCEAAN